MCDIFFEKKWYYLLIMEIINNRYKIVSSICKNVYSGIDIHTNMDVAIKIEYTNADLRVLSHEARVYHYIGKCDGFVTMITFGKYYDFLYLILPLYSISLFNYCIRHQHMFELRYVCDIGITLIHSINRLHNLKLIHRDIKPENILIDDDMQFVIGDMGFCKRYIDDDNNHIEQQALLQNSIIGTVEYMSINIHNNCDNSRRDDVESIIYVLIFMYFKKLPWSKYDMIDIYNYKRQSRSMADIPHIFRIILQQIDLLKFKDEPEYDKYINILSA